LYSKFIWNYISLHNIFKKILNLKRSFQGHVASKEYFINNKTHLFNIPSNLQAIISFYEIF